jgi:hypothetical protein
MPLSTYAELQAAIGTFLDRTDLAAMAPTFIALAEAQMQRDVRHWRMIERAEATFSGRYTALPDDWVETVRLTMGNASQGYRSLQQVAHDHMERERASSRDTAGVPRLFAHVGSEIEVFPTPNASFTGELVYVEKIPALSDSQTTNWLLSEAPDAYLYGALTQTAPYLHEDARVAVWGTLYSGAVARLNAASEEAETSGPLRIPVPR